MGLKPRTKTCISDKDFLFLTESWSDTNIDIPGVKAFVSDVAKSYMNLASHKSGRITLLTGTHVLPVKK